MQPYQALFAPILQKLQIEALNEVQLATIEASRQENDIVLLSPTGTGKTLAFLLPLLAGLKEEKKQVQALILTPTRELAMQIESVFKDMKTPHKVTCCYGGHAMRVEQQNLIDPPALLIATPGRLVDHIKRENIDLSKVKLLVLDEFDKSLEFGFQEDMGFIIKQLTGLQKRILTSATESIKIPDFTGIGKPIRLHFIPKKSAGKKLDIKIVQSPEKDKLQTLLKLIGNLEPGAMIVFCNHRESAERVSEFLFDNNIIHDYFHGGLEQKEREKTLVKFRNGTVQIMVSTDLAARGLDIPDIKYIVHYHLPPTADAFTHRNGRTARMDAKGSAFLILNEEENIPGYVEGDPQIFYLKECPPPAAPAWDTLFIGKGKKDKINKVDIVGFLSKQGGLKKEDVGLIEVKDFFAYVAVKRDKITEVLDKVKHEKIKGKRVKMEVAL
ncbi:MAG: DEAD/DEAH box helicase [Lewinellaceae bacterium]|nr:DEAD/DEAH box helicase [Saprospiraceae bacterium]MCB9341527.1 DEAD/DEAH box helicase [Lewinellaceae bacterium]